MIRSSERSTRCDRQLSRRRLGSPHCPAGVRGLELANVILVKYLGESSFGLRILWELETFRVRAASRLRRPMDRIRCRLQRALRRRTNRHAYAPRSSRQCPYAPGLLAALFPSALTVLAISEMGLMGAQAADWPARPVTVVVGYAAGGNTDVMARMASRTLSEEFRQSFVVDNL